MNHHTPLAAPAEAASARLHQTRTIEAERPETTLVPVQFGARNLYEIESIARGLEHAIVCYRALPAFPANDEVRAGYWKQIQALSAEMMEALRG